MGTPHRPLADSPAPPATARHPVAPWLPPSSGQRVHLACLCVAPAPSCAVAPVTTWPGGLLGHDPTPTLPSTTAQLGHQLARRPCVHVSPVCPSRGRAWVPSTVHAFPLMETHSEPAGGDKAAGMGPTGTASPSSGGWGFTHSVPEHISPEPSTQCGVSLVAVSCHQGVPMPPAQQDVHQGEPTPSAPSHTGQWPPGRAGAKEAEPALDMASSCPPGVPAWACVPGSVGSPSHTRLVRMAPCSSSGIPGSAHTGQASPGLSFLDCTMDQMKAHHHPVCEDVTQPPAPTRLPRPR